MEPRLRLPRCPWCPPFVPPLHVIVLEPDGSTTLDCAWCGMPLPDVI